MAKNQNPLQSKEAAALLRDPSRLKELLSSPETRQLMSILNRQNGGGLEDAARRAKQGDYSGLSAMVSQLMNTREGTELAEKMKRKIQ